MTRAAALTLALLLAACDADVARYAPPDQRWHEWTVHVESRPAPLQKGMNEFWVVISDAHGARPKEGMLVRIRTPESDWIQAIPDGGTGVYRRSAPVRNPDRARLLVRIREEGGKRREGSLMFEFPPQTRRP